MKFKTTSVKEPTINILANDHYVAIPFDCSALSSLATDGVIKAGTIVPANDETAEGVLLDSVVIADDPNGAIVIHGFIAKGKIPAQPADTVNLPMVQFI